MDQSWLSEAEMRRLRIKFDTTNTFAPVKTPLMISMMLKSTLSS